MGTTVPDIEPRRKDHDGHRSYRQDSSQSHAGTNLIDCPGCHFTPVWYPLSAGPGLDGVRAMAIEAENKPLEEVAEPLTFAGGI